MDDVKKIIKQIKNNKKLKILVKILIIIAFVLLSFLVANKHEHWSDEAQSFLLARDTSITEIFKYMKYEGTPPLWVLVIKLFIFLGGNYKTFNILPIILSTLGLTLFEFKIKAPWYIKILFPFTYFIFFQYTIVARSYCLVFPLLMLISLIYTKRFKHPILFSLILFLFMNISLHTLVVAGSIYLIYLIEIIRTKKFKDNKIKISSIMIFFELLLTALITYPAKDCSFGVGTRNGFFRVLLEATVGSNLDKNIQIILGTLILGIFILALKNKEKLKFTILILPVSLILMFIAFQVWHVGIIWLVMFTYFIINNYINNNTMIKIFIVIVCLVQSSWTISSIKYDYNNQYSASKEVANYLKKYIEEDKTIYGLGYSKTAIQPYFEKNIFDNKLTDKSFHIWIDGSQELPISELENNNVDIFVLSEFYLGNYITLIPFLEKNANNYERQLFVGKTYIKNYIYETESYIVYKKRNLE